MASRKIISKVDILPSRFRRAIQSFKLKNISSALGVVRLTGNSQLLIIKYQPKQINTVLLLCKSLNLSITINYITTKCERFYSGESSGEANRIIACAFVAKEISSISVEHKPGKKNPKKATGKSIVNYCQQKVFMRYTLLTGNH